MPAAKGNKYHQKGNERMSDHLHCRIEPSVKLKLMNKAKKEGLKLCEWVTKTLNNAL